MADGTKKVPGAVPHQALPHDLTEGNSLTAQGSGSRPREFPGAPVLSTARPLPNKRDRWNLWNWKVRSKLLAVLLIPAIAAVVLGSLQVSSELSGVQQLGRTVRQVELGVRASDLVHEVQRERELMAFFVAAGRDPQIKTPLDVQKRRVDALASSVRAAGGQLQGLDQLVRVTYEQSIAALAGLSALREVAETTLYSDQAVVTSYSAMIKTLLDLRREVTRSTSSRDVGDIAGAADALGRAKEQVSQQHAVLLVAAVHRELPPNDIQAVRVADSRYGAALAEFLSTASSQERQKFADTVTGPLVDQRERIKQGAVQAAVGAGALNVNISEWEESSNTTSDLINRVESGLNGQLRGAALNLREQAGADAVRDATILLGSLFATLLLVVVVARSMLVPLRTLRDTAFDVADRRLPDAIRRIRDTEDVPDIAVAPVAVHTREEIGQVARAFDAVHGEAVRLAAEQSMLRRNVNDMFVNLSRRSQGLVERQLRLIDQLENSEQDPEQLSNLFQLDHLATRMRRNSENLLVLAGSELARRSARPVPAVDVLRAAVSEVEEYQRIVVQTPPPVNVVGLAVNDLVHLVAELLDNATTFSPPDSRVVVRSSLTDRGDLIIDINDRGVGMAYEQLVEANQRLSEPPTVDVSVSRRMGLFVVGRLAARHDVTIRLGGNEGEPGLTALVTVPADLVQAGEITDFGPRTDQVPAPRTGENFLPTEVLPVQPQWSDRTDWAVAANWPAADVDPAQDAEAEPAPQFGTGEAAPMQVSMVDSMSGADLFTPVAVPKIADSGDDVDRTAEAALREIFGDDFPSADAEPRVWPDTDQDAHYGAPAAAARPPVRHEPPTEVPAQPSPAAPAADHLGADHLGPDHLGAGQLGAGQFGAGEFGAGQPVAPVREETTPIYEEMVSAWFRELSPPAPAAARPAPAYVEPPPFEMPVADYAPARQAVPELSADSYAAARQATAARQAAAHQAPVHQAPVHQAAAHQAAVHQAAARQAAGQQAAAQQPRSAPAPVAHAAGQPPAPVPAPSATAVPPPSAVGGGKHAAPAQPPPTVDEPPAADYQPPVEDGEQWRSPADEGWLAAEALSNPANNGFTAAGLPKRKRGAHLVPGAAGQSSQPAPLAGRRARSADDVRGRLANYQQGLRQGRDARRAVAHASLDPGTEHAAQHGKNEESQ